MATNKNTRSTSECLEGRRRLALLSVFVFSLLFNLCARSLGMEGDNGNRSGAKSRVSSAAASLLDEEEIEDEMRASATSLVG